MLKRHRLAFKYAHNGLWWALTTQENYKIHLFLSAIALVLCAFLEVSYYELLVILLLIVIGFVVECINTAVELTLDAIDKDWRQDIGLAKDVAAGAMLLFAIGALVIAGIIFVPKILGLL